LDIGNFSGYRDEYLRELLGFFKENYSIFLPPFRLVKRLTSFVPIYNPVQALSL